LIYIFLRIGRVLAINEEGSAEQNREFDISCSLTLKLNGQIRHEKIKKENV